MNNKFEILNQDKEFSEKILKMSSETEIVQAFKEKGIEVNHEELLELRKYINEIAIHLESLEKSELEQIAGGIKFGVPSSIGNMFSFTSKATAKTASKKSVLASSTTGKMLGAAGLAASAVGTVGEIVEDRSNRNAASKLEDIDNQIFVNNCRANKADNISKVAQGAAVASVAFAMCYYGKDFVKWWMKKSN